MKKNNQNLKGSSEVHRWRHPGGKLREYGAESLEVYRAVIDLVKSRIEKAKSFGKKKKTKEGIDLNALKNTVIERIKKEP